MNESERFGLNSENPEDILTSSCVTFNLNNETESLGGLLRYILNSRGDVELAGSTQSHPSINELRFRLQVTPGTPAIDVFLDALNETTRYLDCVASKFEAAFECFAD